MPIKSFRGKIANDTQDTIVLHTNNGSTGYKIVKFQLMGLTENIDYETTVKIFKVAQDTSSLTANVDFSDNTLLAAGLYGDSTSGSVQSDQTIIFDNEIFNQDIYVCHKAASGSEAINYYLELEQIKLDLSENTVATLKDIRNLWTNFNTGL
jgi:hypothetical protein